MSTVAIATDIRAPEIPCPEHGCACLALARLSRRLHEADRIARPVTPDLDLCGHAALDGCARGCRAWFRLSPGGVEIATHAAMPHEERPG